MSTYIKKLLKHLQKNSYNPYMILEKDLTELEQTNLWICRNLSIKIENVGFRVLSYSLKRTVNYQQKFTGCYAFSRSHLFSKYVPVQVSPNKSHPSILQIPLQMLLQYAPVIVLIDMCAMQINKKQSAFASKLHYSLNFSTCNLVLTKISSCKVLQ